MLNERGWRHRYDRHVAEHVKSLLISPEVALEGSRAGLNALHSSFEFSRDGETMSVAEAMRKYKGKCETGVIKGNGQRKEFELPYKGRTLKGQEIIDQCNKWAGEKDDGV